MKRAKEMRRKAREVNRGSARARSSWRRFERSTYFCADLIRPEMDEIVITPVWYFS